MTNVILVHGMNANERSWFGVKDALEAAAFAVDDPRLPGHKSGFWNRPAGPASMEGWMTFLEGRLVGDDNVLIGHSMGGFIISQLAALQPHRVSKLIYVAAMLPKKGESIGKLTNDAGTDLEDILNEYALYGPTIWPALSPQPRDPLSAKFDPKTDFASLRRFYIATLNDGILNHELQKTMMGNWGIEDSIELDSDHLPQLADPGVPGDKSPEELNDALLDFLER